MKNFKVSSMTSIITDIFTLWLICIITKYDLSELGEQLSSESTCHKGNASNSRFRRWRQDSPKGADQQDQPLSASTEFDLDLISMNKGEEQLKVILSINLRLPHAFAHT